jgi:predicted nucleotide-binding protein (sugar kinase/HSP70/actin superfamily)
MELELHVSLSILNDVNSESSKSLWQEGQELRRKQKCFPPELLALL